jgi:hypothetical protein
MKGDGFMKRKVCWCRGDRDEPHSRIRIHQRWKRWPKKLAEPLSEVHRKPRDIELRLSIYVDGSGGSRNGPYF